MINLDEYACLLSSRSQVHNEQPPMESKSPSADVTIQDNFNACGAVQNANKLQLHEGKLCAQLNLNSRLAQTQERNDATPDGTKADRTKTIAKTDKIVLYLLSSGLSGGKVERARQIFPKIDQKNVVSIDRDSSCLLLHDTDLGLTVFDFLKDLQTTTKNLSQSSLDLVKPLEWPLFYSPTRMQNVYQQKWRAMIAMKSKNKLEAARPPNGCDYTKLATLFNLFPLQILFKTVAR